MADKQLIFTAEEIDQLLSQQTGHNVLINGDLAVNQREFSGNWSSVSDGDYGWDRWKKLGSDMVQVVEAGNFVNSADYTLSGDGISETQIPSPASGNWTIQVSQSATNIKLNIGDYATVFVPDDIATNESKCYRYFYIIKSSVKFSSNYSGMRVSSSPAPYGAYSATIPTPVPLRQPIAVSVSTPSDWSLYGTSNASGGYVSVQTSAITLRASGPEDNNGFVGVNIGTLTSNDLLSVVVLANSEVDAFISFDCEL